MVKSLKVVLVILSVIILNLIFRFTVNEIVTRNYNDILIKFLYPFNFNQSYIVFYNHGNILYRNEKYSEAISKYEKALKRKLPQDKVCDVRINLSLSMIKLIDDKFGYEEAYEMLGKAKENLYNNNCASPVDRSGDSEEAENLEEEISNLQNKLNDSSDEVNDNEDKDEEVQEKERDDYSDIEEELKEREKEANRSRQSDLNVYENIGDNSYYSGKKW